MKLCLAIDDVAYNKETSPLKLVLVDSVCLTNDGKTHELNLVKETEQFLVITTL